MTPDEHAATVRFKDAVRAVRPRYRELNSPLWDVLDEAVALAERATELERDGTAIYGQWEKLRGELEAVEARATELERERDEWKEAFNVAQTNALDRLARAERAETALRKVTTDHPMIDACPYCAPVVRAALGETAPLGRCEACEAERLVSHVMDVDGEVADLCDECRAALGETAP